MIRLIVILLLIALPCYATDYYIDPDCGTPGDGTSPNCTGAGTDPFDEWSDATIQQGDDFRQKCGTTSSVEIQTITAAGTGVNTIIIGAYYDDGGVVHEDDSPNFGQLCGNSAQKPIIDPGAKGATDGVRLTTGSTYIEINSLQIQDSLEAIQNDTNNNIIKYNYIYNSRYGVRNTGDSTTIEYNYIDLVEDGTDGNGDTQDAIDLSTSDSNTIRYNHISGYDHFGVRLANSDSNTIEKNYIYAGLNGGEDGCFTLAGLSGGTGTSDTNILRYNFCKDAGRAFQVWSATGNEIYSSVYTCAGDEEPGNNAGCIHFYGTDTASEIKDNKIYNVVIYDNYDADTNNSGIMFYTGGSNTSDIENNYFYNIVIHTVRGECIRTRDNNTNIGTNYFRNIDCYKYDADSSGSPYADIETDVHTAYSDLNDEAFATDNIALDPNLNNVGSDEFWPSSASSNVVGAGCDMNDSGTPSACYDAAYAASEKILDPDTTDFTATPPNVDTEEQDIAWVIGAYNYSGYTPPATNATIRGVTIR